MRKRSWIRATRRHLRHLIEEHEEAEAAGGELNLVSYLDIVTNVVMFLLMTTVFAGAASSLTAHAAELPHELPPGPAVARYELNLTVQISERGLTVATADGVLYENDVPGRIPTLPKVGDRYDFVRLTALARALKHEHPGETQVILNADPAIAYEHVIALMDALRSDGKELLFPDVLFSAGIR